MRIAEPIETRGFFWIPNKPEEELPGLLRISETGRVTVELSGHFGDERAAFQNIGFTVEPPLGEDENPRSSRISGRVLDGGLLTLDVCDYWVQSLTGDGLSTSMIHPRYTFVGEEYGSDEAIEFTELSFELEGLITWLWTTGISVEVSRDVDAGNIRGSVRLRQPEDISLTLSNGDEFKFRFGFPAPTSSPLVTEMTVKQTAWVHIQCVEPKPLSYFAALANKFCNFLSLALDENVSIQSLTGYSKLGTPEGREYRQAIRIYGMFAPWTDKAPDFRRGRALFRYPAVAEQIEKVIPHWFDSYDKFGPALGLYFASRTQDSVFLEAKILWLAQALETFHSRCSSETELPVGQFQDRLNQINQSDLDETTKTWLLNVLNNRPTLRKRIRRLVDPFKAYFGTQRERRKFVNQAYDTRNYLTHYDESTTESRAKTTDELFELHGRLEGLFQLQLLKLIGVDSSTIDSIVENSASLGRKLKGRR
ncbi:MAG: hypothetical protein OXE17_04750 [Chloroflexi bacterium]|nr:hypothetical protein [Chloroflexota bacterium]